MTTANAPNIGDLIAGLQRQAASMGVARTALNESTAKAQVTFHDTEQKLGLCISVLTSAPREIEVVEALIAKLEERRAIVLTKQAELEQQVADAPDWRTFRTGRERDAEFDRQQQLKLQLRRFHEGTLLFAPNQVYERVEDLDARIKESRERIERLRAQLAAHLQHSEALLAEPVTQSVG